MKKIKNMSVAEANKAFAQWEKKHSRNDDFDMSGLQIGEYKELFENADREEFPSFLYDLFNYGFMAGYKQSEADLKEKVNSDLHDETHRSLVELAYHLPFGYSAEYFYTLMCGMLDRNVLECIKQKDLREKVLSEHVSILNRVESKYSSSGRKAVAV